MIHFVIRTQLATIRSNNTLFYATPWPVSILQDKLQHILQLSWVSNFVHVSTLFWSSNPGQYLFDGTGWVLSSLHPSIYNCSDELAELFCRYHKVPPKLHGVDTTVNMPTPDKAHLMRICLEANENGVLVKITVLSPNFQMECVVSAPIVSHYTPPGWAMCGFEAYDI